jgi:hypothetical protein
MVNMTDWMIRDEARTMGKGQVKQDPENLDFHLKSFLLQKTCTVGCCNGRVPPPALESSLSARGKMRADSHGNTPK